MKRVCVKCRDRRPSRVFDLLMNENGNIFIELKYPGCPKVTVIRIDECLMKLKQM